MAELNELKAKMEGKTQHVGCLCCGGSEDLLDMETTLYSGFGGWTILKDGETYFVDDSKDEFENWDNIKKLKDIEEEAKQNPQSKWEAYLFLPLREARYERSDCGSWVLVETGMGFA